MTDRQALAASLLANFAAYGIFALIAKFFWSL